MESSNHHADVDVSCQGNHCVREVHTFRLKNLNGIFVLADPPHLCGHCKPPLIFDGPLEGEQQKLLLGASHSSSKFIQIWRNSADPKFQINRKQDVCAYFFFKNSEASWI
jgi:hypothetical protein